MIRVYLTRGTCPRCRRPVTGKRFRPGLHVLRCGGRCGTLLQAFGVYCPELTRGYRAGLKNGRRT